MSEALPESLDLPKGTVEFVVPKSFAARYAVWEALDDNRMLAGMAALGLCWPKLQRRMRYDHVPLAYGARVLEALTEAGWAYRDVRHAADVAMAHLLRSLPEWEALQEQADFFDEAEPGPSSTA